MPKGVDYRTLMARGSASGSTRSLRIPSRKARCKLAIILATILLVFLYTISLPWLMYGDGSGAHYVHETFLTGDDEQYFNYNNSYFVNTKGCKMPSLPIVDSYIEKYLKKEDPLNCTPPLLESDSSSVWFHLTDEEADKYYGVQNASLITCCGLPFERKNNDVDQFIEPDSCFRYGERMLVEHEFIIVVCNHPSKPIFYKDFFVFVPLKPAVEQRAERAFDKFKAKTGGVAEQLNIVILGLDSVSRLNFHRQMPLTAEFVIDKVKGVEMFGYNKVADNTYPNLVPMLTGLDVDELAAVCLPNSVSNSTFDLCPFIWKRFAEAGYRTFYAEDISGLETFNYLRKGFSSQPTDYYLRSFFKRAESNIGYNKFLNAKLCLGGRNPTQILAEYGSKMVSSMKNRLIFALLWGCAMTHDSLNHPALIDNSYRQLLENMEQEGFLDRSVVILVSDHGIRWGSFRNTYQGMMEERQPMLFFMLPKWFQAKYPEAYANIRKNRQRLTSHFDFFETLKDFLGMSSLSHKYLKQRMYEIQESKPVPRGISLFLPISDNRTCEDAGIVAHWCTCHDHRPIPTNDHRVIAATRYTINHLNQKLKKYPQCGTLYLHAIVDSRIGVSADAILSKKPANQFSDISIRFVTRPGGAEMEATVRINSNNRTTLTGSVSRTNRYGSQSYCVDDFLMKLYCYCTR
ncbi:uncharacterized protein LOC129747787 isoform X2 [Uranotaenia lowii]|nr:uncharacterized protein LOC129747787 isoform X2 [Uranotaenia lowii]